MRFWWPLLLGLLLVRAEAAFAFFTTMKYASEEFGRREVLTFNIPNENARPQINLLNAKLLRVTIPGILALPYQEINFGQTRYIESLGVEPLTSGIMGLSLTIPLKEPYLDFRDQVSLIDEEKGYLYRLEIQRHPVTYATGPTRLLEGKVYAGRDGTLLVLSYAGNGWAEQKVDYGSQTLRLQWQGASLDQGWRKVMGAGLAQEVRSYEFPGNRVDMEVHFHPSTSRVFFYRNAEAGTLIVEFRSEKNIGREKEANEIIELRKESIAKNNPLPLNRLSPVFQAGNQKIILNEKPYDEAYFFNNAMEAERDLDFAKSLAYLDSISTLFPDNTNKEVLDQYRMELVARMNWKPGWILSELEAFLSRQPNNHKYPEFRLLQLKLYNRTGQFENAKGMMHDPNLPRDKPDVVLEYARTEIGLREWDEGENHLKRVMSEAFIGKDHLAEANYLLAKLNDERGNSRAALEVLDNLPREYFSRIANQPEWLMGVADIYYHNNQYAKALENYALFLANYPRNDELAPWAMLRAAGSRRSLGQEEEAVNIYKQIINLYPESESAIWARIFKLQVEKDRSLEERLAELQNIIDSAPFSNAVIEAYINKSILLGDNKRFRDALTSLNSLLTLTAREEPVRRVHILKRRYMISGMREALEQDRPEYAVLLGEVYEQNWSRWPGYEDARVLLAEALLRMGFPEKANSLLEGIPTDTAKQLARMGSSFARNTLLVDGKAEDWNLQVSPGSARVRLNEAQRLAEKEMWEGILLLLEEVPEDALNPAEQAERLRLLAQAEAGRGRFPQAVANLEKLLYERPIGDGRDYFWYATLLQLWKGDSKSMPAYQKVAQEANSPEILALAHMRIGDILQRNGNLDEAQKYYQKVLKTVPNSPWAKMSKEVTLQLEMIK
ncbi:MAG: tetratricopeptide repeat protein [Magnetococcales bacterium]|nr:tetratricopeptide repeat protein [Magnetococcales bacterium]NGZ25730.1 tetratricopeptide repeat protein [Magnetococcales bacterium]